MFKKFKSYVRQELVLFNKSNRDYLIFGRRVGLSDDGVRALGQQNETFIGMMLILIFDEALGLYWFTVVLIILVSILNSLNE